MMNSIGVRSKAGMQSFPEHSQLPISRKSVATFTRISFGAIPSFCAKWSRRFLVVQTLHVRWQSLARTAWGESARKQENWIRILSDEDSTWQGMFYSLFIRLRDDEQGLSPLLFQVGGLFRIIQNPDSASCHLLSFLCRKSQRIRFLTKNNS